MILSSAPSFAWWLAGAAALAYVAPVLWAARGARAPRRLAFLPAWLLHAATLAWALLGTQPHFGFAPALSMTVWLGLTTYTVERQMFPHMRIQGALSAIAVLGATSVLAAQAFPGLGLPATASPWLALHLSLGLACYGLFGAALVHAWLMGRAERQMRQASEAHTGVPLLTLERLTFRFVSAGFVLLTATLVAGWSFGEQLYGHAWRWNHKAVFALLAWVTFAVLLLGRQRFGWRGRKAVRVLYGGCVLLLLAYAGTRFVLEVLLGRGL